MTKEQVTVNDVIHCENLSEFNRIMQIFNMDNEYLNWHIFERNTVLFPFEDAYGEINGYAKKHNYNIICSAEITHYQPIQKPKPPIY